MYNQYLYSRLVHALIIDLNDYSVPYDMEYAEIDQSFKGFLLSDLARKDDIYQAMCDYINDDETLYSNLRDLDENV